MASICGSRSPKSLKVDANLLVLFLRGFMGEAHSISARDRIESKRHKSQSIAAKFAKQCEPVFLASFRGLSSVSPLLCHPDMSAPETMSRWNALETGLLATATEAACTAFLGLLQMKSKEYFRGALYLRSAMLGMQKLHRYLENCDGVHRTYAAALSSASESIVEVARGATVDHDVRSDRASDCSIPDNIIAVVHFSALCQALHRFLGVLVPRGFSWILRMIGLQPDRAGALAILSHLHSTMQSVARGPEAGHEPYMRPQKEHSATVLEPQVVEATSSDATIDLASERQTTTEPKLPHIESSCASPEGGQAPAALPSSGPGASWQLGRASVDVALQADSKAETAGGESDLVTGENILWVSPGVSLGSSVGTLVHGWIHCFFTEDLQRSCQVLATGLHVFPNGGIYAYLAGYAARRAGDTPLSLALFRKSAAATAESLPELSVMALGETANVLFLQCRWEESARACEEFLRVHQGSSYKAASLHELGVCLFALGQEEEAVQRMFLVKPAVRPGFTFDAFASRKATEFKSRTASTSVQSHSAGFTLAGLLGMRSRKPTFYRAGETMDVPGGAPKDSARASAGEHPGLPHAGLGALEFVGICMQNLSRGGESAKAVQMSLLAMEFLRETHRRVLASGGPWGTQAEEDTAAAMDAGGLNSDGVLSSRQYGGCLPKCLLEHMRRPRFNHGSGSSSSLEVGVGAGAATAPEDPSMESDVTPSSMHHTQQDLLLSDSWSLLPPGRYGNIIGTHLAVAVNAAPIRTVGAPNSLATAPHAGPGSEPRSVSGPGSEPRSVSAAGDRQVGAPPTVSGCTDEDLWFDAKQLGFLLLVQGRMLCNIAHSMVGGEALRDHRQAKAQVTHDLWKVLLRQRILQPGDRSAAEASGAESSSGSQEAVEETPGVDGASKEAARGTRSTEPVLIRAWMHTLSDPRECLRAGRACLDVVVSQLAPLLRGDYVVPHCHALLSRTYLWEAGWGVRDSADDGGIASTRRLGGTAASISDAVASSTSQPGNGAASSLRYSQPQVLDIPPHRPLNRQCVEQAHRWHSSALAFSAYDFDKPLVRQLSALGDRLEAMQAELDRSQSN